jgi:hypothetical protein
MAEVKLNTNAYIHKTGHEGRCAKFANSFSRKRLPRGTKLDTLPGAIDLGGMTRVKIVMIDTDLIVSVGGWKEGDIGYVRTAKLQLSSHSVMEKLKLSNPSLNGVSPIVGQMGVDENEADINEICLNANCPRISMPNSTKNATRSSASLGVSRRRSVGSRPATRKRLATSLP